MDQFGQAASGCCKRPWAGRRAICINSRSAILGTAFRTRTGRNASMLMSALPHSRALSVSMSATFATNTTSVMDGNTRSALKASNRLKITSGLYCALPGYACPPEDVGGPHGYAEFLKAIHNPRHPEHQEYPRWCGGAFDPSGFDLNSVLSSASPQGPVKTVRTGRLPCSPHDNGIAR